MNSGVEADNVVSLVRRNQAVLDEMQAQSAAGPAIAPGSGGPHTPDMEARVAVLEQIAKITAETLSEVKSKLRILRENHDRDFRLTFAAVVTVALGLAGLMAKGFHWL